MAEGARLERGYMGNCIGGSNPPLSAIIPVRELTKRLQSTANQPLIFYGGQSVHYACAAERSNPQYTHYDPRLLGDQYCLSLISLTKFIWFWSSL